jgi:hypothetical protein
MSVYKEIGDLARKIKSQSRQIWNDAADFGVPIESYDDPLIAEVKALMQMYMVPLQTKRYDTGFTQTYVFDGGYPAVIEAGFERMWITFTSAPHKVRKSFKGYLSVETWSSDANLRRARQYDA